MIAKIKNFLYFPVASYFRFFASIRLRRWNPKIIVVTGSNGKTTLLHMLEAQIGGIAKYSHFANSSYGIPFDILDLHRKSLLKSEWISLILKTPYYAFRKPPKEKVYIVEADCDRPGEGKFLASFLNPEIVLWISTAKTHSMNFERLVSTSHPERSEGSQQKNVVDSSAMLQNDIFNTVEESIAYEFGYFLKYCSNLSIINGDSELMKKQIKRTKSKVLQINKYKSFNSYHVSKKGTEFEIDHKKYSLKYLLPEEVFYSISMTINVCDLLNISFDQSFIRFNMPPGRGTVFNGIQSTTLVDSTYNANLSSMDAVIKMFNKITSEKKWIVIGDMLELGEAEKEEHEKLADLILKNKYDRVIFLGPRVKKYSFPKLKNLSKNNVHIDVFENPPEVLDFILTKITGGEVILFKGARFMEGIIEHLLENKDDVRKLPRREKIWEIRRKQWGL